MKTCPIALRKIQEHFAPVGVMITITPAEEFLPQNGWHGPSNRLSDIHAIKHLARLSLEVSDEVAIGFLIHEILHSLTARPAWDHTLNSDVYNWTRKGTIIKEEILIVFYGRDILKILDIQEAATDSSAIWEVIDGVRKHISWKAPGGNLFSHDNLGNPTKAKMNNVITLLSAYGVTDMEGNLIGPFNPNMSNNTIKKIKSILNEDDVLGLVPQVGSPIYKRDLELIAA